MFANNTVLAHFEIMNGQWINLCRPSHAIPLRQFPKPIKNVVDFNSQFQNWLTQGQWDWACFLLINLSFFSCLHVQFFVTGNAPINFFTNGCWQMLSDVVALLWLQQNCILTFSDVLQAFEFSIFFFHCADWASFNHHDIKTTVNKIFFAVISIVFIKCCSIMMTLRPVQTKSSLQCDFHCAH